MKCPDALATKIMTTRWSVLPPILWFFIASPLLNWAGIGSGWFKWPHHAKNWFQWQDVIEF